jgi:hypothetical protein
MSIPKFGLVCCVCVGANCQDSGITRDTLMTAPGLLCDPSLHSTSSLCQFVRVILVVVVVVVAVVAVVVVAVVIVVAAVVVAAVAAVVAVFCAQWIRLFALFCLGWWRASNSSIVFYRCIIMTYCLGGVNSECQLHRTGE